MDAHFFPIECDSTNKNLHDFLFRHVSCNTGKKIIRNFNNDRASYPDIYSQLYKNEQKLKNNTSRFKEHNVIWLQNSDGS